MMNNREIVLNLIPEIRNECEDYINAIVKRYDEFMEYSQLPEACYGFDNTSIIPDKLKKLFTNIHIAVQDKYSFIFLFRDYINTEYLAYLMTQVYFRSCILKDIRVEEILYIDTKLLVEDYKKLMNANNNEPSPLPVHSLETLYSTIEKAPIVIWDKMMLIDSNYDRDKLYDIINVRNRKGLGNFYFAMESMAKFSEVLGPNLALMVNEYQAAAFNCSTSSIPVDHKKEVQLFI